MNEQTETTLSYEVEDIQRLLSAFIEKAIAKHEELAKRVHELEKQVERLRRSSHVHGPAA